MNSDVKFYMSRKIDGVWEEDTDIVEKFDGIGYSSSEGLSDKGEIKNIYKESYAESSKVRVHIPKTVAREETSIRFVFAFKGENRRDVYDSFVEWISGHEVRYWDTMRKRVAEMILTKSIEPDDDYMWGSDPYLKATFEFDNINGTTEKHI